MKVVPSSANTLFPKPDGRGGFVVSCSARPSFFLAPRKSSEGEMKKWGTEELEANQNQNRELRITNSFGIDYEFSSSLYFQVLIPYELSAWETQVERSAVILSWET